MTAFDAAAFLADGSARNVAKKIQTLGGEQLDELERVECAKEGDPRLTILRAIEKRRKEIDAAGPEDDRSEQDDAIGEILQEAATEKAEELNEKVASQSHESPSFLDQCIEGIIACGYNGGTIEEITEKMGGEKEGVHSDNVYSALLTNARSNAPRVVKASAIHFLLIK